MYSTHVNSVFVCNVAKFKCQLLYLDNNSTVPPTSGVGVAGKAGPRMREFFIKWEGKSYWECSWVIETEVNNYNYCTYTIYCTCTYVLYIQCMHMYDAHIFVFSSA